MFSRNKRRRQCASVASSAPAAEVLEPKALLSVNAVLQNGTLLITGTNGSDIARVELSEKGVSVHTNGGEKIDRVGKMHSIVANMGGGDDQVSIQTHSLSYTQVSINMGGGRGERVNVYAKGVQYLQVDCKNSTDAFFCLDHTNVTNLNAFFGNGRDKFLVLKSAVEKVRVEMGGGNDFMEVALQSRIRAGRVNMGDGNDEFALLRDSKITAEVSGGTGWDLFRGFRQDQSGTRLRDFEQTDWWNY